MKHLYLLLALLICFGVASASDHTALVIELKNGKQHVYAFTVYPA